MFVSLCHGVDRPTCGSVSQDNLTLIFWLAGEVVFHQAPMNLASVALPSGLRLEWESAPLVAKK